MTVARLLVRYQHLFMTINELEHSFSLNTTAEAVAHTSYHAAVISFVINVCRHTRCRASAWPMLSCCATPCISMADAVMLRDAVHQHGRCCHAARRRASAWPMLSCCAMPCISMADAVMLRDAVHQHGRCCHAARCCASAWPMLSCSVCPSVCYVRVFSRNE